MRLYDPVNLVRSFAMPYKDAASGFNEPSCFSAVCHWVHLEPATAALRRQRFVNYPPSCEAGRLLFVFFVFVILSAGSDWFD